jgi:hypothetical protein
MLPRRIGKSKWRGEPFFPDFPFYSLGRRRESIPAIDRKPAPLQTAQGCGTHNFNITRASASAHSNNLLGLQTVVHPATNNGVHVYTLGKGGQWLYQPVGDNKPTQINPYLSWLNPCSQGSK